MSCGAGLVLAAAAPASAQSGDPEFSVELLQLMVDEGLLSAEKAQGLLDRARARVEEKKAREVAQATAIEVPYVPEIVREQIRDEVKAEVIAKAQEERWITADPIPKWIDGIELSGDIRLRREQTYFNEDNFFGFPDLQFINDAGGVVAAEGVPTLNTTNDFGRSLYRARLGVKARVAEAVEVGLRLGAGRDRSPISTNALLGEYFQKDGLWIDRAYLSVRPIDQLTLTGGRMPNPFFSTDLVWDEDINPEGVAATVRVPVTGKAGLFAVAGAFPLESYQTNAVDLERWMWGVQAGGEVKAGDLTFKAAVAYYDYRNLEGVKNSQDSRLTDYTALPVLGIGNSKFNIRNDATTQLIGLSSDFDVLNATASLGYRMFDDVEIRLTGDYARNLAFDADAIAALESSSANPGDTAWQVRLDLGSPAMSGFGDWFLGAAYKRLETDSVLDIFTDSDFGAGGTDLEGYVLEGGFGVYRNTWLGARWLSADAIDRAALVPVYGADILMIDLNAAF
ncbi:hypothetical protein AM2010_284 [Pelagerythrobacter marensis]|uniref:Outer membrane receptor for ferric coprogen and ferric-rhodotorulic acid n=2 Tax=Pelagerythrobacter marensis TaxID=543877 RepID=A0A0G3X7J0_9SPHN|nr:hypothetical protein AM2010_284 [Pelagerythrobacter marensis]